MIYEVKGEIRGVWFTRHAALTETEGTAMLRMSQQRHPGMEFKITKRPSPVEEEYYVKFLPEIASFDLIDRMVACRRAEHQAENLRRQISFDIVAEWDNEELNKAREAADKHHHEQTGYYYPGGRGAIKAF